MWCTGEYLGDVGLRGQADHDVQFLQFHINWVIVLDKEHFDLLLEDLRPEQKQQNRMIQLWEDTKYQSEAEQMSSRDSEGQLHMNKRRVKVVQFLSIGEYTPFLDDEVDVPQSHVLDLRLSRQ